MNIIFIAMITAFLASVITLFNIDNWNRTKSWVNIAQDFTINTEQANNRNYKREKH